MGKEMGSSTTDSLEEPSSKSFVHFVHSYLQDVSLAKVIPSDYGSYPNSLPLSMSKFFQAPFCIMLVPSVFKSLSMQSVFPHVESSIPFVSSPILCSIKGKGECSLG
jgi:hypothetical protein